MENEAKTGRNPIYQPLNQAKREIRLIKLENRDDDAIHCEMRSFSLDEPPQYTALSYCWGEGKASCEVQVNNLPLSIRTNLFEYLTIMTKEQWHSWLFIDALCVDQDDPEERTSQVGMMGDVYWNAEEVVAWIVEQSFNAIDRDLLRRYCSDEISTERLMVAHSDKMDEFHRLHGLLMEAYVFHRYWSRLWIVQELVLARNLTLRAGEFELNAEAILPVLETIKGSFSTTDWSSVRTNWHEQFLRDPSNCRAIDRRAQMYAYSAFRILHTRDTLLEDDCQERPRLILPAAIVHFGPQECLERCDRVFGLLGITKANITPDYDMPMVELYTRILAEGVYRELMEYQKQSNVHNHEDGQETKSNTERALAKVIQFSTVLKRSLGLPWHNPVIVLITREIFRLCGLRTIVLDYTDNLLVLLQYDSKRKTVGGWIMCKFAKIRLQHWERRNELIPAPCDSNCVRRYQDWIAFAGRIHEQVKHHTDVDQTISQPLNTFFDDNFVEDLNCLSIGMILSHLWHSFPRICSLE